MTDEDIMMRVTQCMEHENGRDYYSYYGDEHWWGTDQDFIQLARLLLEAKE